jgi:cob(I)alamin adenosyltransferase
VEKGLKMRGTGNGERGTRKPRGLILVFTGDGKGKTTAAMGTALRMVGHGKRIGMVQFLKQGAGNGERGTGEIKAVKKFGSQFNVWSFGGGFTWSTSREENAKAVQKAWKKCCALLEDSKYSLVVLDEIHIALKYKFLKVAEVIKALKKRPAAQHVILTGRGASRELIKVADLVTEMKCVKHPFKRGILAQPGIEF